MKYSVAVAAAVAPLAMAKAIQNSYPLRDPVKPRNNIFGGGFGNAGLGGSSSNGIIAAGVAVPEVIIIWQNAGNNAATQTVTQPPVTVTQTVVAGAEATTVGTATVPAGATSTVVGTGATHTVTVGGASGLVYTPPSLTAAIGDMVVFMFQSKNHTVTQSGFTTPCVAMEGGMDSGFQPNADDTISPPPMVAMQVTVDTPLWFYCRQEGHCGKGMVFSVNPTADKSQELFQQMAIAQAGAGASTAITGGTNSTTGGTAPPAAESSAAAGTATASAGSSIATGTGSVDGTGACVCAVSCGVGAFPVVAAQGIANFGGFAGSLPSTQLEVISG